MAQVHGLRGRAPTRVEVEGLTFLDLIQNYVEISVRKEDSTAKEMMNWKGIKLN
jgi:hypothetical protein